MGELKDERFLTPEALFTPDIIGVDRALGWDDDVPELPPAPATGREAPLPGLCGLRGQGRGVSGAALCGLARRPGLGVGAVHEHGAVDVGRRIRRVRPGIYSREAGIQDWTLILF